MSDRLYTTTEMANDFKSYPRKIKAVMAMKSVNVTVIGSARCVDREGYEKVREGLAEFDSRPNLRRTLETAAV